MVNQVEQTYRKTESIYIVSAVGYGQCIDAGPVRHMKCVFLSTYYRYECTEHGH